MIFHFLLCPQLGKRNPAALIDVTTLDTDSWKCDSQIAKVMREASTVRRLGAFFFCGFVSWLFSVLGL
jgi:hypothetical protein